MEEAAVDDRDQPRAVLQLHPQRRDRELHQQRGVPPQDPDHPVRAVGHEHLNVARPQLLLGRDQMDLDRHEPTVSSCLPCSTASSIPPTMKNACSGRWS